MNKDLERKISEALDQPGGVHADAELAAELERDPEAAHYARDLERIGRALADWPLAERAEDAWDAMAERVVSRLDDRLPLLGDPTRPPIFVDPDARRDLSERRSATTATGGTHAPVTTRREPLAHGATTGPRSRRESIEDVTAFAVPTPASEPPPLRPSRGPTTLHGLGSPAPGASAKPPPPPPPPPRAPGSRRAPPITLQGVGTHTGAHPPPIPAAASHPPSDRAGASARPPAALAAPRFEAPPDDGPTIADSADRFSLSELVDGGAPGAAAASGARSAPPSTLTSLEAPRKKPRFGVYPALAAAAVLVLGIAGVVSVQSGSSPAAQSELESARGEESAPSPSPPPGTEALTPRHRRRDRPRRARERRRRSDGRRQRRRRRDRRRGVTGAGARRRRLRVRPRGTGTGRSRGRGRAGGDDAVRRRAGPRARHSRASRQPPGS